MKTLNKLVLLLVLVINSQYAFAQNYIYNIRNEGLVMVVEVIPQAGSNPPTIGSFLTDVTLTITYPTAQMVVLGAVDNSAGYNVIKAGGVTVNPSFPGESIQGFQLGGLGFVELTEDWTENVPVELFRIPYSFTVSSPTAFARIATQNEINPFQPNLGIDFTDEILPVSGSIALPITLKSFDVKKHSASSAMLNWTTSKEVNSDYFGIERSIDGSTWDEIARVKAAGDSNVDIAYDYIDDRLPLSRTNGQVFYYRLRLTDLDGAYKYSDVRGVNFDKQALGPISIYPNPTTEIVNIDLSEVVMEDGDVYVSVYDMSGRLVMTKQIIGSGIELIKVDHLPSDAYNFIIRQGEQIHQQRVIKID